MPRSRRIGDAAERLAVRHLLQIGYTIVKRNYKRGSSELDIVAMEGEEIVFVEVRSRNESAWETAEESVTPQKQKRLWETAQTYLAEMNISDRPCRFDVIAVNGDELRHYRDAFRPAP